MKIDVPYGKDGTLSVALADSIRVRFLEANDVEIGDEDQNIREALLHPINSKAFQDFLKGAKNVLVIVNDATRPTPKIGRAHV